MGETKENDAYEEELLDYEEEDEKVPDSAGGKVNGESAKNSGFRDFLLKPELLRAIVDSGFEHPSEDILGVIINQLEPRQLQTKNGWSTIQELVIVNEELKPKLLTTWDHFVSNECVAISNLSHAWPIVVALRLKVVSFNELSLVTKSSSSFLLHPDIPEAIALQKWISENEDRLKKLKSQRAVIPLNLGFTAKAEDIKSLSSISSSTNDETIWVNACATITNLDQTFWYMACNKCHKGIAAEHGRVFACIHCNQQVAVVEPRCRFEVQLKDESGTLCATIFAKNAEKLFSITAINLMENTNEDGIIDMKVLEKLSNSDKQFILLKSYMHQTREKIKQKFNIMAVQR